MIINLHVGLPKTATTSLQNTVFPYLSGVSYLGKGGDVKTDESLWAALRECWDRFATGQSINESMDAWFQSLFESDYRKVLISEEVLMEWPSPRDKEASKWFATRNSSVDQRRSGPHPINEFLSMVIERMPSGAELRAILTLRNQADFMGSLGSELGKSDPHFIERALRTKDPSLAFQSIVEDLQSTLGRENLLILFYEDGPESNSKTIADFVGAEMGGNPYDEPTRLNVKRVGDGVWETATTEPRIITLTVKKINETDLGASLLGFLKRIAPWLLRLVPKFTRTVKISSDQKQRIQSHFRRDNDQLSELVGRDLRELGY